MISVFNGLDMGHKNSLKLSRALCEASLYKGTHEILSFKQKTLVPYIIG